MKTNTKKPQPPSTDEDGFSSQKSSQKSNGNGLADKPQGSKARKTIKKKKKT